MSGRGSFFLRLLGVVILVGVMLAGGALLFRAGQAQGYQMGVAASAASAATAGGETPSTAQVAPYGPGYWSGYGPYYPYPHFGFFPFGWLCGSIFFVFLALFALRWIFFPHRWHHDGKGGWGEHPHAWGPHPWGPPNETRSWGTSPSGTNPGADQTAGGSPA